MKQMIEQEAVKVRTGGEVVLFCTGILVCSTQIMVLYRCAAVVRGS